MFPQLEALRTLRHGLKPNDFTVEEPRHVVDFLLEHLRLRILWKIEERWKVGKEPWNYRLLVCHGNRRSREHANKGDRSLDLELFLVVLLRELLKVLYWTLHKRVFSYHNWIRVETFLSAKIHNYPMNLWKTLGKNRFFLKVWKQKAMELYKSVAMGTKRLKF